MKPARKWITPTSQVCKEEEQSKPKTAGNVQARAIKCVSMFGSAEQIVTETKSSLPALQELPSHQELVGNQVRITKKPGRWSRFGRFRVDVKKTQGSNQMCNTTKKRREAASTPRKMNPHELCDQELKIEEGE